MGDVYRGGDDSLEMDDLRQGGAIGEEPVTIPLDYIEDEAHSKYEYDEAMRDFVMGHYRKWNAIKAKNKRDGKFIKDNNGQNTDKGIGISDINAARWLKHNKGLVETAISTLTQEKRNLLLDIINDTITKDGEPEADYAEIKEIIMPRIRGGRRRKTNKVNKSKMRVFRRRSIKSKKSRKSRKYVR
jgi:hypothetical protein